MIVELYDSDGLLLVEILNGDMLIFERKLKQSNKSESSTIN